MHWYQFWLLTAAIYDAVVRVQPKQVNVFTVAMCLVAALVSFVWSMQ